MKTVTFEGTNTEATYCPEDNKLRLYCGRVEREEYLRLRSEGWTSTPKQDCDFVSTWRVIREDTALQYGNGIIGDEDQSPAERAIDRAERFQGYQQKRLNEACDLADKYDSKDTLHGFQDAQKAERSAARHDRIADKSCLQWSKAEYWQSRTAGVIANALYKGNAGLRMSRIKDIETSLRKYATYGEGYSRQINHLNNRLAYENQMLSGLGGRLEQVEIVKGGKIGKYLICKVNKSPATRRVTSVCVYAPAVASGNLWEDRNDITGTSLSHFTVKTERLDPKSYTGPTEETLQELKDTLKMIKDSKKAGPKKPALINPTIEAAQALQDLWNERTKSRLIKNYGEEYFNEHEAKSKQLILELTQKQYSYHSKGSYARLKSRMINTDLSVYYSTHRDTEKSFKLRLAPSEGTFSLFACNRVIVITDKPQKAFPVEIKETAKETV